MLHWRYLLHDTNTDRHTRALNVLGQLATDWGIKKRHSQLLRLHSVSDRHMRMTVGGMIQGKAGVLVLGEKPKPGSHCQSQIPRGLGLKPVSRGDRLGISLSIALPFSCKRSKTQYKLVFSTFRFTTVVYIATYKDLLVTGFKRNNNQYYKVVQI